MKKGLTNAEYLRMLRQRAAANGLCYQCRCRPAKPGRRSCQDCIDRSGRNERSLIATRRCINCCCNLPPEQPQQMCPSCRDQTAERTAERRAQLLADRICVRCAKQPAVSGITQCIGCNDEERDRMLALNRLKGAQPKPCGICGQLGHNRRSHDRLMERAKEWRP